MKIIRYTLILIVSLIVIQEKAHSQWILKVNGLKTDYNYSPGIAAYGDKTACVGFYKYPNGYIYKTTNGGDNWFELPWGYRDPISISIIDNNKIWAATSTGEIYSTNNGGTTWNLQFSNPSKTKFFNYIKMFDENNGIAMGDAPANDKLLLILRTTNGGLNWIATNDSFFIGGSSRNDRRMIYFTSPATGYLSPSFSGQYTNKLYKTTDGGKTWSLFPINFPLVWLVKFYNDNIGFVATYDYSSPASLHRTTDGGDNWQILNTPSLSVPRDLEFVPGYPSKIWLTDYNKLFFQR
jgi:photosystem II stability/assembly factor-like uncharacterized protein